LLAKNSGMVSTWPTPMKRSRVFTCMRYERKRREQCRGKDDDEHHVEEGKRAPIEFHPAAARDSKRCRLREGAETAGEALAEHQRRARSRADEEFCTNARSRSQMTLMPKRWPRKERFALRMPGAMKSSRECCPCAMPAAGEHLPEDEQPKRGLGARVMSSVKSWRSLRNSNSVMTNVLLDEARLKGG